MEGGYILIWRFRVRPGGLADFLEQYGGSGGWVRLFRRSPGYIETQLLKDRANSDCYLTVDRWRNEAAYADFRRRFAEEYARLDQEGEGLTRAEEFLGAFCPIDAENRQE